jgi:hypothetical protein
MTTTNAHGGVNHIESSGRPSRLILRVSTPEAVGLSGAGSRADGSGKPRSDSDLRLTLPSLGSGRAAR